jgi:di/tricarboxylate transporter
MVMLVLITAVASAFLDNVTTVLLVAPVTLLVCDRLRTNPIPYLIAEIMASNIGGAATLIGDPPNIIIASRSGLSFNDFLINMGPIVVILMVVYIGIIRVMFRSAFHRDDEAVAAVMALDERESSATGGMLYRSLAVLGLVVIGFVLHSALHLEPSIVALLGAGLMVVVTRTRLGGVSRGGRVADPRLLHGPVRDGRWPGRGRRHREPRGEGHRGRSVTTTSSPPRSCCGDRRSCPGSSTTSRTSRRCRRSSTASPAALPIRPRARRCGGRSRSGRTSAATPQRSAPAPTWSCSVSPRATGHPISFWQFTKYGIIVATITIAISWPYVWLRYFAFA